MWHSACSSPCYVVLLQVLFFFLPFLILVYRFPLHVIAGSMHVKNFLFQTYWKVPYIMIVLSPLPAILSFTFFWSFYRANSLAIKVFIDLFWSDVVNCDCMGGCSGGIKPFRTEERKLPIWTKSQNYGIPQIIARVRFLSVFLSITGKNCGDE